MEVPQLRFELIGCEWHGCERHVNATAAWRAATYITARPWVWWYGLSTWGEQGRGRGLKVAAIAIAEERRHYLLHLLEAPLQHYLLHLLETPLQHYLLHSLEAPLQHYLLHLLEAPLQHYLLHLLEAPLPSCCPFAATPLQCSPCSASAPPPCAVTL